MLCPSHGAASPSSPERGELHVAFGVVQRWLSFVPDLLFALSAGGGLSRIGSDWRLFRHYFQPALVVRSDDGLTVGSILRWLPSFLQYLQGDVVGG